MLQSTAQHTNNKNENQWTFADFLLLIFSAAAAGGDGSAAHVQNTCNVYTTHRWYKTMVKRATEAYEEHIYTLQCNH
jgi:hypothetical protein